MAKRFRFSLETVLRVRKAKEEKVQLEYSRLLEQRAAELRELGRLERSLQSVNSGEAARRGQKLLAGDISRYEALRRAMGEKISFQLGRLHAADEQLEAKRLELVAATRDRKVLEKLEEAQFGAYLEKLNREEQGFLDELARYSGPSSVNAFSAQSPA